MYSIQDVSCFSSLLTTFIVPPLTSAALTPVNFSFIKPVVLLQVNLTLYAYDGGAGGSIIVDCGATVTLTGVGYSAPVVNYSPLSEPRFFCKLGQQIKAELMRYVPGQQTLTFGGAAMSAVRPPPAVIGASVYVDLFYVPMQLRLIKSAI